MVMRVLFDAPDRAGRSRFPDSWGMAGLHALTGTTMRTRAALMPLDMRVIETV